MGEVAGWGGFGESMIVRDELDLSGNPVVT